MTMLSHDKLGCTLTQLTGCHDHDSMHRWHPQSTQITTCCLILVVYQLATFASNLQKAVSPPPFHCIACDVLYVNFE